MTLFQPIIFAYYCRWPAEECSQPVHLFIRYQTCEHGILKTNHPILMEIGSSGPRGKDIKLTLGSHP